MSMWNGIKNVLFVLVKNYTNLHIIPSLQADTHEALALFERDFPLSMQVNYTCTYIDFPCLHT